MQASGQAESKTLVTFSCNELNFFFVIFRYFEKETWGGYTLMLERLKDVSFCFIKGLSVHSESTLRNIEGSEDQ